MSGGESLHGKEQQYTTIRNTLLLVVFALTLLLIFVREDDSETATVLVQVRVLGDSFECDDGS